MVQHSEATFSSNAATSLLSHAFILHTKVKTQPISVQKVGVTNKLEHLLFLHAKRIEW